MKLETFLKTVESSSSEQWHEIPDVEHFYGWDWEEVQGGVRHYTPITFSSMAVFKDDIDISVLMGASANRELYRASWATAFPDATAHLRIAFFRYRGAVVYRCHSVLVDGGRYLFPAPKNDGDGGFCIDKSEVPLARLLFDIHGGSVKRESFDEMMQQARIRIIGR